MILRITARYYILVLAVLYSACDNAASPSVAVRDSSGVTIVTSAGPRWLRGDAWQIDPEPIVIIGGSEDANDYQFDGVRKALRLNDGSILVANRGSSGVTYFDSAGKYVRSVGGPGDGPGEYRLLSQAHRYGNDSLIIWDLNLHRGTVLSLSGQYGRNIRRPPIGDEAFVYIAGAFNDRSLLGVFAEGASTESAWGVSKGENILFRYTDENVDTIGSFFASESYVTKSGISHAIPFSPRGAFTADGAVLHFTAGDYEIRTYRSDGSLARIARVSKAPAPVTSQMRENYVEGALRSIRDARVRLERKQFLSEVPFPRVVPAFSDLVVDREGNLWAGGYHQVGEKQRHWSIFDPMGRYLGDLQMPTEIEIHEIGSDFVLGRETNELGVERIAMYRILK